VVEELAARSCDAPALLSDRECLTYREFAARLCQYARRALECDLCKCEVVCLSMTNRPECFSILLGITSVGGVVALLNNNSVGASLAHCIKCYPTKAPHRGCGVSGFVGDRTDGS